jgi:ATP-dependent Clp protease ATP-binding subunit ClpB
VSSVLPAWLREVDNALAVSPHVVLAGNVQDCQLVEGRRVAGVVEALWEVLARAGYEALVVFDAADTARVLPIDATDAAVRALELSAAELPDASLETFLLAIHGTREHRVALAIERAGRLIREPTSLSADEHRVFSVAERLGLAARPVWSAAAANALFNPTFWIVSNERELPPWFVTGRASRLVTVPLPDGTDRRIFARRVAAALNADGSPPEEEAVRRLVDASHALPLRAVEDVVQLARRLGVGLDGIDDAARAYRVGVSESPWRRGDVRERVREGNVALGARVLGQDAAVRRSLDILMRSVTGMTGAHASSTSSRPRGVLFLAGPTGVGKTELAKSLTSLIFGDDDAYVRFDMSEFSAEHAEARLIGAPPGYVGHDAGGELTNAMRTRPFSLVLFDEIEKAHPRILDKFLQVLEDGRLTDGGGSTVYFTEAILVFTSNVGMDATLEDGSRVNADVAPDLMEQLVRERVERHFREVLNRPELLNRLGDNIVVFRYITPEVGERIFALSLARVGDRLERLHGARLVVAPPAYEALLQDAVSDLSLGGRGIGSRLETSLVNPLARRVFIEPPVAGTDMTVVEARSHDGTWELEWA